LPSSFKKIIAGGIVILLFISCSKFNLAPVKPPPFICGLDSILNRAGEQVLWSVEIRDLSSDSIIYHLNNKKRLIPASNAKLFTTAAALDHFGPDYRFKTSLLAGSLPDSNGCLQGNLYIKPSCDPTISKYFYADNLELLKVLCQWIGEAKDAGIYTVYGDIVLLDCGSFESKWQPTWEMGDLQFAYATPYFPFSFNGNCIDVELWEDHFLGDRSPVCGLFPPLQNFIPHTRYKISGEETGLITLWLNDTTFEISGNKERNSKYKRQIPVTNPELFSKSCIKLALTSSDIIRVSDTTCVDMSSIDSLITLAEYISPPLSEIIKVVNTQSVNHIADQLTLAMGKDTAGYSYNAGVTVINGFISETGIDTQGIHLVDGSGLSRHNWISAAAIVTLLDYCYRCDFSQTFINSFARYGYGTFYTRRASFLEASDFYHRIGQQIYVKTGSMTGVRAFSGYILTKDKKLAFAFICNNYSCSASEIDQTIDIALEYLVNYY